MSLSPTDPDPLRPANPDDVIEAISHALRHDGGRRRVHHADGIMARVTADLLVRHLLAGDYVIIKKGRAVALTTSNMPTPHRPRSLCSGARRHWTRVGAKRRGGNSEVAPACRNWHDAMARAVRP